MLQKFQFKKQNVALLSMFHQTFLKCSWGPPSLLSRGYQGLFPWG